MLSTPTLRHRIFFVVITTLLGAAVLRADVLWYADFELIPPPADLPRAVRFDDSGAPNTFSKANEPDMMRVAVIDPRDAAMPRPGFDTGLAAEWWVEKGSTPKNFVLRQDAVKDGTGADLRMGKGTVALFSYDWHSNFGNMRASFRYHPVPGGRTYIMARMRHRTNPVNERMRVLLIHNASTDPVRMPLDSSNDSDAVPDVVPPMHFATFLFLKNADGDVTMRVAVHKDSDLCLRPVEAGAEITGFNLLINAQKNEMGRETGWAVMDNMVFSNDPQDRFSGVSILEAGPGELIP